LFDLKNTPQFIVHYYYSSQVGKKTSFYLISVGILPVFKSFYFFKMPFSLTT